MRQRRRAGCGRRRGRGCGRRAGRGHGGRLGPVVVTVVVFVSRRTLVVSSPPLSARAARLPTRAPPMKRIAPMTAAATSFLLRSPPSPLAPRDSGRPEAPSAAPDHSCVARLAPRGPWTARHPARRTSRPLARGAEWRADPSSWSRRYFLDRKARCAAGRLDAVRPGHRPLTDARAYGRAERGAACRQPRKPQPSVPLRPPAPPRKR